jgi:hypothetical protein
MRSYSPTLDAPPPEVAGLVAAGLGLDARSLNAVDFDDLEVTEFVRDTLRQLARTMAQREPGRRAWPRVYAFWVERSRELVLATACDRDLSVLVAPQSHWSVKSVRCH